MKIAPLLALIRKAETGNRYDVAYAFKRPDHKALDAMTINEVRAYQEGLLDGGSASTACGAYQIIRKTMAGLVSDMGLDGSEVFDEALQDRMATELLRRRGLEAYLAGRMARNHFAHSISQEWASFPNVLGKGTGGKSLPAEASYYSGDGLNHAQISMVEVMNAIPTPDTMTARADWPDNPAEA